MTRPAGRRRGLWGESSIVRAYKHAHKLGFSFRHLSSCLPGYIPRLLTASAGQLSRAFEEIFETTKSLPSVPRASGDLRGMEKAVVNHPNRSSAKWFGPLPGDDEQQIVSLIKRYGYARIIAAVIRKMPKLDGIDTDELGL